MTERPLVTLFVTSFDQKAVLSDAVEGAFSQTYQPLEILLSDDCSEDGSFRVLQQAACAYRGSHTVVLNRNPTNLGIVGHVNRIVELASGDLIVASGGDDVSEPDRVTRLVEAWTASRGTVHVLHSAVTRMALDGTLIGTHTPHPSIIADPAPLTIASERLNCIGATMAWTRSLWDRFGPLPNFALLEDAPLFFRAAMIEAIRYVDRPLVRYRVGGMSDATPVLSARDYFYGDRVKFARWHHANMRSFLRDMEKIQEFRDARQTREFCRKHIEEVGFESALADRHFAGRLALAPLALRLSLSRRQLRYVKLLAQYLTEPAYSVYYNLRYARNTVSRHA